MTTTQLATLPARVDVLVVGAGIVGLAHALDAVDRGLTVLVVDRDDRAVGASVRNFGHGCFTAQDGVALNHALVARESWLRLAKETDLGLREVGTLVVARADDEHQVLEDLAAARDGAVVLLDRRAVLDRVPALAGDVVGGAHLPLDVCVDQRRAVGALAELLAGRPRAAVRWGTAAQAFDPDGDGVLVRTSRGSVVAGRVIVAVGHDVDRHFPETAAAHGVRRCRLHMLEIDSPSGTVVEPAVLTGTSLLRYGAFAVSPALPFVRSRLQTEVPELLAADINLMLTARPGGTLTLGDTHAYATTHDPFGDERLDDLLLDEAERLLGGRPTVRSRWNGTYASAPEPFLVAEPMPRVHVVSVTSGIGMTTALGLAPAVLDDVL